MAQRDCVVEELGVAVPRLDTVISMPIFFFPPILFFPLITVVPIAREVPAFINYETTLSNGYLGSRNDEERSEMRYVMRIAEFSESSSS